MTRVIAGMVLFCSIGYIRAETAASASAAELCSRAKLQHAVEQYLDALKKGAPSSLSVSPPPKYIENRQEVPLGQGIWKAPLSMDFSRSIFDVETCESYTEIVHTSSGHPYVIGTRLKAPGGKIAEIESLVTDKDDWLFNAEIYLKYSSLETWNILPANARSDRATLIKAANAYFDFFSDRNSQIPFGVPCARLEGGTYTNPKLEQNASCTGGPPLEGTLKITNRRFIVDLDMGTVVGLVDFGPEKGLPDAHMFRLENGKLRYIHTMTVCTTPYCGFPPKN